MNTNIATLSELVDEYVRWLSRRKAKSTMNSYGWSLRSLARALGPDCPVSILTTERLTNYYENMLTDKAHGGKGYKSRSIRALWQPIKNFCAWLIEKQHLPENPFPTIKAPRLNKPLRPRPNRDIVDLVLQTVETIQHPYRRLLFRAAIYLLHTSAVRLSELVEIRIQDLDLDHFTLSIPHGKGDKPRIVILPDPTIQVLRDFLAARPTDCQHDYLLCWNRIWRVNKGGIYSICRQLASAAELQTHSIINPHAARRGWATLAHRSGVPLKDIQDQLGHTSLKQTAEYIGEDEEERLQSRNIYAPHPIGAVLARPVPPQSPPTPTTSDRCAGPPIQVPLAAQTPPAPDPLPPAAEPARPRLRNADWRRKLIRR